MLNVGGAASIILPEHSLSKISVTSDETTENMKTDKPPFKDKWCFQELQERLSERRVIMYVDSKDNQGKSLFYASLSEIFRHGLYMNRIPLWEAQLH